MSDVVRFVGEGDEELLVEIDEQAFGIERVARDTGGIVEAGKSLDSMLESSFPAIRRLVAATRDLAPDEHTIEFGIKLNAEAGVIVAKTSAEGHFVVKLTWKQSPAG